MNMANREFFSHAPRVKFVFTPPLPHMAAEVPSTMVLLLSAALADASSKKGRSTAEQKLRLDIKMKSVRSIHPASAALFSKLSLKWRHCPEIYALAVIIVEIFVKNFCGFRFCRWCNHYAPTAGRRLKGILRYGGFASLFHSRFNARIA